MKIKTAVTALAALAQESRMNVFRLLVKSGSEGLPAGVIAERLGIPPATLSFHLKELVTGGLIESRREGRSMIYALRIEGIRVLMGFLTADCCQGRPELCTLQLAGGKCGVEAKRGKGKKKLRRKRRAGSA